MPDDPHTDVIVIGGGHAGAEAAWAVAGMGAAVTLVTMDPSRIGAMSCNPAIGGLAKGQMVREIDALGGLMARAADATGLQFRVLNRSKGSAVHGPRCQSDKYRYARTVQRMLGGRRAIRVLAGTVERIEVSGGRCTGVLLTPADGGPTRRLGAGAVVLTTGTFMRGLMHTGEQQRAGGRVGERAAVGISGALGDLGFALGRLKTGTPPRLAAESLALERLAVQPGDADPLPFAESTDRAVFPTVEQRPCHITHTNQAIHDAIRANLDRAPMYNGQIETTGPRYCPSIEDKVVRFADRSAHQVYLEPESLDTNEIYCNGISTSLPPDVQTFVVRHMAGCEHARILRFGYAVEYDMVWPHQIDVTCMTKRVDGLFLAGQINGTSGYEEAAGQGLLAGLNAVRHVRGCSLVRLRRDQAYIGVMMDDLVTKTPREPYRMFTSRAEFRLLLRADNADERLTPLGHDLGLVDHEQWRRFERGRRAAEALRRALEQTRVDGLSLAQWACRPDITPAWLHDRLEGAGCPRDARDPRHLTRVLADLRYAGYVERHRREIDRLAEAETEPLAAGLDYDAMGGVRKEARQALARFRPTTFGQAGRLAGVTPADLMALHIAVAAR